MTAVSTDAPLPLPDAVRALLEAADADALLRDAESLAEGLTDAGWAAASQRRRRAGRAGASRSFLCAVAAPSFSGSVP